MLGSHTIASHTIHNIHITVHSLALNSLNKEATQEPFFQTQKARGDGDPVADVAGEAEAQAAGLWKAVP